MFSLSMNALGEDGLVGSNLLASCLNSWDFIRTNSIGVDSPASCSFLGKLGDSIVIITWTENKIIQVKSKLKPI